MAGMVAQNVLDGTLRLWYADDLDKVLDTALVLDVRSARRVRRGHLPEALNVPHTELRDRLDEMREAAGGRPVRVHCASGFRSYLAHRVLDQAGLRLGQPVRRHAHPAGGPARPGPRGRLRPAGAGHLAGRPGRRRAQRTVGLGAAGPARWLSRDRRGGDRRRPSGSTRTTTAPPGVVARSGKSSRKWPPRLSVRRSAAAVSTVATWCRLVVSHSAVCGAATTPGTSCARAAPPRARRGPLEALGPADHAGPRGRDALDPAARRARRPAPASPARSTGSRGDQLARRRPGPRRRRPRGGRRPGPRAASSTRAGSRRARRCRPTSPAAYSPVRLERPRRSVSTPAGVVVLRRRDRAPGPWSGRCPRCEEALVDGREPAAQEVRAEVPRVEEDVVRRRSRPSAARSRAPRRRAARARRAGAPRGMNRTPSVSSSMAPSPRTASETRVSWPLTPAPSHSTVGWNCTNSTSATAAPARSAAARPSPVACARVGRGRVHLADPARREDHGRRQRRADAVPAALADDVQRDAADRPGAPVGVGAAVSRSSTSACSMTSMPGSERTASSCATSAREISAPVASPPACAIRSAWWPPSRVSAIPPSGAVSNRAPSADELPHPVRPLGDQDLDGRGVAQPGAGDQGVREVRAGAVLGVQRRGDAALRPHRGPRRERTLGDQQHPAAPGCAAAARRSAPRCRSRRRSRRPARSSRRRAPPAAARAQRCAAPPRSAVPAPVVRVRGSTAISSPRCAGCRPAPAPRCRSDSWRRPDRRPAAAPDRGTARRPAPGPDRPARRSPPPARLRREHPLGRVAHLAGAAPASAAPAGGQRAGQRQRGATPGGVQIGVARGQRQAVAFAHRRHADDLDRDVEVGAPCGAPP